MNQQQIRNFASIHTKCFVSDWKLSRVTPIYKGNGGANDKGNYRPISVIGHIAKIIEREITNQVVTYIESNKLLTSDQSAYRAHHSTQTALHKVVDIGGSRGGLGGTCPPPRAFLIYFFF